METFPYKLKLSRKAAGPTQTHLPKMVGVTKQALSKYERGDTKPDSTKLLAFANALERKPQFFATKPRLDLENISFRKRSHLSGTRLDVVKADVPTPM